MKRWWVFGVVLTLIGCGGGGASGPQTDAPVVSNLVTTFLAAGCNFAEGGGAGTRNNATFAFADRNGDLTGGTVTTTTAFTGGNTFTTTSGIPSASVGITGTTSGTITVSFCTRFGRTPSLTRTVSVTDAAGNTSNALLETVTRPVGAPEVPRSGSRPESGTEELILRGR